MMKNNTVVKGKMRGMLRWPLYLSLLIILMNIPVYFVSVIAGLLVSAFTVAYVALAISIYINYRPMILSELISFANQYTYLERKILEELDLPYVLMSPEGQIIWCNAFFTDLIGVSREFQSIKSIFPELSDESIASLNESGGMDVSLNYKNHTYRASMQKISIRDILAKTDILEFGPDQVYIISMYLHDETELNQYKRMLEEDKMVVALAYLDNYEEAMETVEEVRRSLLIALIDRKIAKYFAGYDGVVRKLEKDKYLLFMKKSSLRQLIDKKFNILEEVKTVNIGNEMAITLSIGIGTDAPTCTQNYEYARSSIELALGRGGDQVVIKDADNIRYFGGKSQQMEKTTRVKARVKAQALKEIMATRDQILVMGHKISDVDALGAGIGIYRAGKALGKPVHIVINNPSASIKPIMSGFINNPDYEPNMFIDGDKALEMINSNTVVIVVDTNKPAYTECPELLSKTKTIVVLDHHRRGNDSITNAVLSYIEPYASSACEMVAEILQYFADDLRIHQIEADSLYAGMVIDTNNFIARTGVRTFEAAAYLRRCGADTTRVRKLLRDDIIAYQARADAVRNAIIYRDHYALSRCKADGLESPTVVGSQAANELLNINEVKASFVLTPYKGEVYVSARTIDEVNVQVLMEKIGGGGHINMAGAQLKVSMSEAEDTVRSLIDEMLAQ